MLKKLLFSNESSQQEKEHSILIGLVFGFIGLCPAIAVVILANSVTVLSDLLKNVSLVFAVFLSWIAARRVARGKTPDYNYGYGKLENLSSLVVATMMIVSIAVILYETVERFQNPQVLGGVGLGIGVVAAGLAAIANAWLWWRDHRLAQKLISPVMESLWRLYRVKTISSSCVCFSLVLSLALKNVPWAVYIDPIGSIVLLGFLGFSAYGVISMSVYDLLDRTLDESLQFIILQELAAYFEDYGAIHGIRSRRSGGNVYIEIFLEFDGESKMAGVQKIIDNMKVGLEQKIPGSQVFIVPTSSSIC